MCQEAIAQMYAGVCLDCDLTPADLENLKPPTDQIIEPIKTVPPNEEKQFS